MLICDTTLRDGEQMPGVVFSYEEKMDLATKFSEFGVDIIEIMPSVSDSEKKITVKLCKMGLNSEVTASTMLKRDHIETAIDCDVQNITLFTPLSDLHLKYKLGIDRGENLDRALEMLDFAKEHGLKVNFAGEDSTRADIGYVIEFINALAKDIEYFIPCDTLGCLTPRTTYAFFRKIKKNSNCKIGLHEHNDFGLATANTLAGIDAGAELFSGTFAGIGERAGNASIEEVCIALKFLKGIDLDVDYSMLREICNTVQRYSQVRLQPHKPIVGDNAFSHESGIHADGVIKHPRTYENFDPEFVGHERRFLFGKHSGRGVLKYILDKFGLQNIELDNALKIVKNISEYNHRPLSELEIISLFKQKSQMKEVSINEYYTFPSYAL